MTTARTSRLDAEVLAEADAAARVSRLSAEALAQLPSTARVSAVEIEVVDQRATSARLSGIAIEVLRPTGSLYEGFTADEAFSVVPSDTPDVATGHITATARSVTDDISGLLDVVSGQTFFSRSAGDATTTSDSLSSHAVANRSAADALAAPVDGVTHLIRHMHVRYCQDDLVAPLDIATHLTRPAGYAPPPGGKAALKRVTPNQFRSYSTRQGTWSSDVPVSAPRPYTRERPVLVDFGGFGFTTGGIAINVSESDIEEAFSPFFEPPQVPNQ